MSPSDPAVIYGLHAQQRIFCMRPECISLQDCAHRDAGRPCWSQQGMMLTQGEQAASQPPVIAQMRNDMLLNAAEATAEPEREWTYVDLCER
jgi:hypothetical protein